MSAALGLTAAAACAAPLLLHGGAARAGIAETVGFNQAKPANLKCEIPKDFCNSNPNREDHLSFRDCDGDGELDPYCEGGELLRFGYISSKNDCKNNWPSGLCKREREDKVGDSESTAEKAAGYEITILHFNDVYEVAGVLLDGMRRGGMSRAAHVINEKRKRNPDRTFAVFAGDLLSPSALSDLFEGKQMIDILNYLKIDAASLGNHEFDFGVDRLIARIGDSEFPWLNVNLKGDDGNLIQGTQKRLVKDVPFTPMWSEEQKSTRVCFFGASYDVRETMFKDKSRVEYTDILDASEEEAKHLRESEECKVVVALTHQFSRDDCAFSKRLGKSVDLILGGHDHSTELNTVCGHAPYAKADSDLKTQWVMTIYVDEDGKVATVDGQVLSLTDADPFDEEVHTKVVEWEEKGEAELNKNIGCAAEDMDGVAAHNRNFETNLGNFFTDSVRAEYGTDVALINGGTIRGDKTFPKGDLSKKTIMEMHPFGNAIVMVYMKGSELKNYIGKQLRCWEDKCGNFVQISGLKYTFDSSKDPLDRLVKLTRPNGDEVGDDEEFTVALTDYMLANSPYKKNKLYNMVTTNDAVPIVQSLFTATIKAGSSCVSPKTDGRITNLAED